LFTNLLFVFCMLGDHIVAVSVLDNLSYVWSISFFYEVLLTATKCISSSILTMAPFIFISLANGQNIINIGIQIIISDSYDINQRLGPIKVVYRCWSACTKPENKRSCICVGYRFASSTNFLLDFVCVVFFGFYFFYYSIKWLLIIILVFVWPLCCLSFFDLWILITPFVSLVSWSSSCVYAWILYFLFVFSPYSHSNEIKCLILM